MLNRLTSSFNPDTPLKLPQPATKYHQPNLYTDTLREHRLPIPHGCGLPQFHRLLHLPRPSLPRPRMCSLLPAIRQRSPNPPLRALISLASLPLADPSVHLHMTMSLCFRSGPSRESFS